MSNMINISKSNSDETLNNNEIVLLDFYANWCGPCKMLSPVLDELAKDNEDKIVIGKVNVDENLDLASTYGIRGIPSIVFFKNGKEVERLVGLKNKKDLQEIIDGYLVKN